MKIWQLFTQPLEPTVSAWSLAEDVSFRQDCSWAVESTGVLPCLCLSSGSIAPGTWDLGTFEFIVSVWNWALLTHLVLTANNTRYVLLDCNNDLLISNAGTPSVIRKSTQVSVVHCPHTCPAPWMAVFRVFLLSASGHVLQVEEKKTSINMSGGNKPFVSSGFNMQFLKYIICHSVLSLQTKLQRWHSSDYTTL